MAPSIKDQLPILKALVKWFTKQDLVIDSLVFRLHHQVKLLTVSLNLNNVLNFVIILQLYGL